MPNNLLNFLASGLFRGVWAPHPPRQSRNSKRRKGPISPPLPPRARALTLTDDAFTSIATTTSSSPCADPQSTSPLFHLPRELRLQIYTVVLGDRVIHLGLETQDVQRLTPYLRHFYCKTPHRDPRRSEHAFHDCWYPIGGRPKDPVERILALLLTCRRIYSESILLLYSASTFQIISPALIIALPTLILPSRVSAIRTLVLGANLDEFPPRAGTQDADDFAGIWQSLNAMQGLRLVHVHISVNSMVREELWAGMYEEWLESVRELRDRVGEFTVFVPYGCVDVLGDAGRDGPCRILEPGTGEDQEGE